MAVGDVVAFADAVHTACARTVDSAEDVVSLRVAGRENLEYAAVDGYCAVAIERVVDNHVAGVSTTGAAAIQLGDNNTVVNPLVVVVF